jgi:hypothetical protein
MGHMTEGRATPLRPLGVAEILDGAVRLVQRNARGALTISAPFAVARAGVSALLTYATLDSDSAATFSLIGALWLSVLFGTVLTGLLAPMFGSDLLSTRIAAGNSLRRVGNRAWPLLALAAVATVAEGAGLFACLVVGVWLWGIWAVAAPALVTERTGTFAALRRSAALVSGSFWRVWGIRALGYVLTFVLNLLITLPFQLLASSLADYNPFDTNADVHNAGVYVTINAIGALITATLTAPVSAAIDVVLYADLRMRKEGLDVVLALPPAPVGATV